MLTKINRCYPKLRGAFAEHGYEYAEVARRINRSEPYIANVMTGRADPRLSDCYKILELIGATPDRIGEYFTKENL